MTHLEAARMAVVRAFIVDDNPTLRANLAGVLRDMARVEPVGEADSEAGGSAWLREHAGQWDLAIVDLFIGDGSGLRVLEACRVRDPGQRVVVLSNHTTHEVRVRCRQLGADAVFDKATEFDDLIDFCLRSREARLQAH